MTDPLRKPVSGEPFVPSARQFGMFIDSSLKAQETTRGAKGLIAERDSGVILVRNDTGSDLTNEHAIVGLDPPLIIPDDRGNVVFERPVFAGIAPAEGQPFAILLQPLADGAIGKAVISGGAWVRVEVGTDGDEYADAIEGESARLLTGGAGSARVLWLGDDEELDPDVRWAYIRLGDSKPVLFKAAIGVNPLIDTGGAVAADLQRFNSVGGVWEDDPLLPEIQVWPGGGFIGVAFPDQLVDVYFSLQSNRWQAINGGSVVVSATSEFDIGISDSGITATVGVTEITIDRVIIPVPAGKVFRALWSPYEESGVWIAIGRLTLGCGLEYDLDPAAAGILNLDGAGIAGDGLQWDDENCLLSIDGTEIDCTDLATALPCCSTICDRLDQLEQDVDDLWIQITNILVILNSCCEGSGSGSDGSDDDNGTDKSTAIVPASWSPGGYTALFVEECPEVRFDDVVVCEMLQADGWVSIDPKYVEVCEPGTIEVCGTSCNEPLAIGAQVMGNEVFLRFAEQDPQHQVRIVIRLTGIRKGFEGHRFPDRTRKQFEQNEAFIRSAYDA